MSNLWENDLIQFARLLCEIEAVSGDTVDWYKVAESMDLDRFQIGELLERANNVFEASKRKHTWNQACRRYDRMGCDRDELGDPVNPDSCFVCGMMEKDHGKHVRAILDTK
jgi:hypothetical protein